MRGIGRTIPKVFVTAVAAMLTLSGCAAAHGTEHETSSSKAASSSSSSSDVDLTKLPLGDGHVSTTSAKRGSIYECRSSQGGGGAQVNGPWINGSTYDLTAKATVEGSVDWDNAKVSFKRSGSKLKVSGNGLPVDTPTGVFPIASGTEAFNYDRNPNSIKQQSVSYTIPRTPTKTSKPGCLSGGPIGVAKNGVAIFNGLDAEDRDAVAHEVQDKCSGHPQQQGLYHYHSLSPCLFKNESKTKASGLFGYALDGYRIYGPRGAGGKLITNDDLDECHGRVETIKLNGKRVRQYVYHATYEYPYTLGCFHGKAAQAQTGEGQGGPPQGGPPPML